MKTDLLTATNEVIESLNARVFVMSGIELDGVAQSSFEYRYTYELKLGKRWAKVVCVKEERTHIYKGVATVDSSKGGIEFFIDTTNGNVHKQQGPVAAKTPRYNLLNGNSRQQLIVNAQASQHGSYLYQDFANKPIN